jgi:hypothetical protein
MVRLYRQNEFRPIYCNPVRTRGYLYPQERLNNASSRRLWGRKDELRAVNRTALIGSGEVNNRGLTNAGTNPSPTVWLRTRLK